MSTPSTAMNPWGNLFNSFNDFNAASQMRDQNYPNPADSAMPYFNKIPGTISPYYQPYIGAGNQAISSLMQQYNNLLGGGANLQSFYGNLMQNPGGMLNQIGQNFQQSPGFNFQVNQATNAANNVASAGGMAGSPAEQQSLATTVNGLANQDYYNWLNNAQNLMGQGLQGASNLYGMGLSGMDDLGKLGFNASNELATSLGNTLGSQGQLAYSGQANQNMMNMENQMAANALDSGGWSSLGGALGGLINAGGGTLPGIGSLIKGFF